jgi:hypothetical protein
MLTIRKFRERTPEEMQNEMNDRQRQRQDFWYMPETRNREVWKEIQTDLLDVVITQAQREAIRKEIIEKF